MSERRIGRSREELAECEQEGRESSLWRCLGGVGATVLFQNTQAPDIRIGLDYEACEFVVYD